MPQRDDLTAEEIAGWLTPRQAIEILDAAYENKVSLSRRTLLERLQGGMVQAISNHSVFSNRARREILYKIPSEDWGNVDTSNNFWTNGDLIYSRRDHGLGDRTTIRHFDVRFEPQGVRAIVASAALPSVAPRQETLPRLPPNKGGAPRKEWWDDFWIAICGQIWEGDLKPNSQADLERAMLDWASAHNHAMSETSAKVAARKLFKAWKLEGKN
jgi:hypothetical protein